ncbi:MAG: helix-turn-helix domain-containing protein [Bacillota bacterium]
MNARKSLDDYPENMTVAELMEFLNIGQSKAYQLVTEGEVESFKIGPRNKRIIKSSVAKYIEKNMNSKTGAN